MVSKRIPWGDEESLHQLAGVTGLGWTTALLGYLGTAIGYGNSLVTRLAVEPQSLLYLGLVFLLATLGLDRVGKTRADG